MTRRLIILGLVLASLGYRLLAVEQTFWSPQVADLAGFDVTPTRNGLVVAGVSPQNRRGDRTPAAAAGLLPGDRLLAVVTADRGEVEVHNLFDLGHELDGIDYGEAWGLVVARGGEGSGARLELRMPALDPDRWDVGTWVRRLAITVWVPLLAWLAGALIGLARGRDENAFVASLMLLAFSAMFFELIHLFPPGTRLAALVVHITAFAFAPYLIFRFFLRFPVRSLVDRSFPSLDPALLTLTALLWVWLLIDKIAGYTSWPGFFAIQTWLSGLRVPGLRGSLGAADVMGYLRMVVTILSLALGSLSLVANTLQAERPRERRRLALLLAGVGIGLAPMLGLWCLVLLGIQPPVWSITLVVLTLGVFPASFVYVVLRHRVFGIRVFLRRGLQYALISRGFLAVEGLAIFAALYYLAGPALNRFLPASAPNVAPVGAAALALLAVAGIRRVNRTVMPAIDRRFFRDAFNAQQILSELVDAAARMASRPADLLDTFCRRIGQAWHPHWVGVWLRDDAAGRLPPHPLEAPIVWSPSTGGETTTFELYALATSNGPAPTRPILPAGQRLVQVFDQARQGAARAGIVRQVEDDARGRVARLLLLDDDDPSAAGEEISRRMRLVAPLVSDGEVIGCLGLGEKRSEEPYGREDQELMTAVARQLAMALGYARLIERAAEQESMRRELEIAEQVQAQLFPRQRPQLLTLEYEGACRAARGVGGDTFDFVPVGPNRLGLTVGDITGKGISAALLMSTLQAMIRSQAPVRGDRLEELAAEINRLMCDNTDDAKFATLFYGVYDDTTRRLEWVNCGHNPPFVIRRGEHGETVRIPLGPTGTAVGMFRDETFERRALALEPGDLLVIYSDGVIDAQDEDGEMFGEERLVRTVDQHRDAPVAEIVETVLDELETFAGSTPQHDDETLIVARVR